MRCFKVEGSSFLTALRANRSLSSCTSPGLGAQLKAIPKLTFFGGGGKGRVPES